jgi:phenylalanyl-tRNA synthetase beta chain
MEDGGSFLPSQRIAVHSKNIEIGQYGNLDNDLFYYEFNVEDLVNIGRTIRKYEEVAKYPAQIEDITLVLPEKTLIGNLVDFVSNLDILISNFELKDSFNDSFTFRIWYQDLNKTLTDKEVEKVRREIISKVSSKFGATIKE